LNRAERAKLELQRQRLKAAKAKANADEAQAKEKEAENMKRIQDERGKLSGIEKAVRKSLGMS
jgi:hypothetical protein